MSPTRYDWIIQSHTDFLTNQYLKPVFLLKQTKATAWFNYLHACIYDLSSLTFAYIKLRPS